MTRNDIITQLSHPILCEIFSIVMGWMVLFLGKISRDDRAKFHAPPSSKTRRSLYARWR